MNRRTKNLIVPLAVALSVGATAASTAAFHDEEKKRSKAGSYRHNVMEQVKYSAQNVGLLLNGFDGGQDDAIATNLANFKNAVSLIKGAFKKDTRDEDRYSESKDAIWENWDDYAAKADKMVKAVEDAEALYQKEGAAALKSNWRGVFRNCKACHDDYRKED